MIREKIGIKIVIDFSTTRDEIARESFRLLRRCSSPARQSSLPGVPDLVRSNHQKLVGRAETAFISFASFPFSLSPGPDAPRPREGGAPRGPRSRSPRNRNNAGCRSDLVLLAGFAKAYELTKFRNARHALHAEGDREMATEGGKEG